MGKEGYFRNDDGGIVGGNLDERLDIYLDKDQEQDVSGVFRR